MKVALHNLCTQGPNYIWHVDTYKLKSYGISISGCIDGYIQNVCPL